MSVLKHEDKIISLKQFDNTTSQELRERVQDKAKDFKRCWIALAQSLFAIWRDKLYQYWGYEKFEDYTEKEVGMKKSMAMKMLKAYDFVEQQEPQYLKSDFLEGKDAVSVPEMDAVHVLRLAKNKKELTREDYTTLKRKVFDEAVPAGTLRKDLTSLIKERKQIDPEEEREERHTQSVRRFMTAINSFKKDMDSLRLIKASIVDRVVELLKELEEEVE